MFPAHKDCLLHVTQNNLATRPELLCPEAEFAFYLCITPKAYYKLFFLQIKEESSLKEFCSHL